MLVRVVFVPLFAVVLGLCATASFFIVGGRVALLGPHVLASAWFVIYLVEAIVSGAAGYVLGRTVWRHMDRLSLGLIVIGAWLGELVILGSGLLADELLGLIAIPYWLMATGGPIQPLAAIGGGLLGLRSSRTQTVRASD